MSTILISEDGFALGALVEFNLAATTRRHDDVFKAK